MNSRDRGQPFEVVEHRDLVYSHAGDRPRLADLYLPQGLEHAPPVIIWLHGGGWRFGDRRMAPDLNRFFAQRGFAMVSFDYRLSEEATFPAAVEDAKTVVRWVRSIARNYGLDSDNIGYWGSSAGAHLAALAALSTNEQFVTDEHSGYSSEVQAVVDGYGPVNFALIDQDRLHAASTPANVESVSVPNLLPASDPDSFESRFLGETVSPSSSRVAQANPACYSRADAPPFFLLHGRYDPLMPWQQSKILFDSLSASGGRAVFMLIERLGHGFFNRSDLDSADPGAVQWLTTEDPESRHFQRQAAGLPFGFGLVEAFFRQHLRAD